MFDRKVLKTRAKYVLARSFFPSLAACLLVSFISDFGPGLISQNFSNIATVAGADFRIYAIYGVMILLFLASIGISIFIAAPLTVGLKNFMLRAADMDVKLDNITTPFKTNYKKVVWVTFVKNLFVFLWALPGMIPVIVTAVYFNLGTRVLELNELTKTGSSELAAAELSAMFTLLMLATFVFMIPAYIKALQYSMVEYILAQNPEGTALEIIGKSKEMMVGNKWAYVKLSFSFLGWAILGCFVCCGLGLFALIPYEEATYAQMYLEISGQGKDYSFYDIINPNGGYGNM